MRGMKCNGGAVYLTNFFCYILYTIYSIRLGQFPDTLLTDKFSRKMIIKLPNKKRCIRRLLMVR